MGFGRYSGGASLFKCTRADRLCIRVSVKPFGTDSSRASGTRRATIYYLHHYDVSCSPPIAVLSKVGGEFSQLKQLTTLQPTTAV